MPNDPHVTAAEALSAELDKLETFAGHERAIRESVALAVQEARVGAMQLNGYRALVIAVRAFLGSLRFEGGDRRRKLEMLGMITEADDASVRLDGAMLIGAAAVPAAFARGERPGGEVVSIERGRGG